MPRYHTNSKQVLRDGKHFADCIDDGAARLIADALNERKGMPVEQPVLPLDGADGPLFVGDKVMPRRVNEKLMTHAKEADLRLLKGAGTHRIRQENDEYACSCGTRWAVEDGEDHP